MKLKRLAAALGLALAAAPTFASIGTDGTDSELFAVVFDETVGSYAIDLGINLDSFIAASATPGYSFSVDVGPAYTDFFAADTNPNDGTKFDGTRWAIFAVDSNSFGDPGEADGYRYLTTAFGNDMPVIDNSSLQLVAGETDRRADEISFTGTHLTDPLDVAVNGESFNPVGSNAAYVEMTNGVATVGVFAGNVVNDPARLYYFYSSSFDAFEPSTRVSLPGVANFDGTSFSYAVAAVPEPSTYALMLAGLLTVGFIARRRS